MVGLGDLAGGAVNSYARDVSADGSVIVGVSSAARYEAFRWTSAGGMASLGDFPGGSFSQAAGVSADGTVVAGAGDIASGSEAFRWTSAGGMIGLGDLPGDGLNSQAMGISADGSVVVGYGHIQGPFIEELGEFGILDVAWRWTAEGGLVDLGDPLGRGRSRSVARAVSADGTVVVGRWGGQAFRWTADTGMVLLGDLPGDNNAWGVSADGSVIVGSGMDGAFVWDATLGRRNLRDVLVGLDVDVTGWDLAAAHDVSHDGLTIVGVGTNPGGFREAWLAKIPEPSTAWLLGSGLGGLAALRLRSRMRSLRSPKTRPDRSPAASSRFSVAAPCNERQRRAVATELDGTKPGDPSSGPPGTGQRSG
jgi:probable HAF family extracellular repeat protein